MLITARHFKCRFLPSRLRPSNTLSSSIFSRRHPVGAIPTAMQRRPVSLRSRCIEHYFKEKERAVTYLSFDHLVHVTGQRLPSLYCGFRLPSFYPISTGVPPDPWSGVDYVFHLPARVSPALTSPFMSSPFSYPYPISGIKSGARLRV